MPEEQCPRRLRFTDDEALARHSSRRPGKRETRVCKPLTTAGDLSLASSPGNMVAVISNGTAVPGLGNVGALAGKPVMEDKVALFRRFADVDGIDLEVDTENLEDIKAPVLHHQALRERDG